MQLCAITNRRRSTQPLLRLVEAWSAGGVDFIQLREKDLEATALQSLTLEVMAKIDRSRSKLLVNIPAPELAAVALAAGADGVHLAGKPRPGATANVRQTFREREVIISVPCHTLQDIDVALKEQVDLILFSPVFEKLSGETSSLVSPLLQGLDGLRRACAAAPGTAVFALGGVTATNAPACITEGAAGVAGIRLFAGDDWRRLQHGQTGPMEPYIVG
jgi:thiamine-phosphate pyrophosphorylase